MKAQLLHCSLLLSLIFNNCTQKTSEKPSKSPEPSDYLFRQRAYPTGEIPDESYYEAVQWAQAGAAERGGAVQWNLVGPTNVGGRITDIDMHPADDKVIYAASASGGVWKSTDQGDHWFPITDKLPSLSVGDIAVDPGNKNTLWVGTGEPNGGGGSVTYDGRGVFKSLDAGQTWSSAGLEKSGSIGRVVVDPENGKRAFVAAMGNLFANNSERGVFRTLNGGQSWEKVLFVNDSTGAIDLCIHPQNPDTIYAATWERVRRHNKRIYGGPGCAVWRSFDGGDNWTKLSNGLPASDNGRIGITLAPSNPSTLFAIYANKNGNFKNVYKSMNHGDSWTLLTTKDPGYSSYGWWFGQIRVHPTDEKKIYTLGLDWLKTEDGGTVWSEPSPYLHADYHALYIHPGNPNLHIAGNDGGIYISKNAGIFDSWVHRPFPITQFYTSEINYKNPKIFAGGAQDYGTWATLNGAPDDWYTYFGGDGFVTLFNPIDPSIYYAEYQYGVMQGSNGAQSPPSARYNWNTPYVFDPNNPDIMYIGAEKLFKSVNGGINWTPISPDLSKGLAGQGIVYGTITAIAVSPVKAGVLIAGTDDGNVWVTQNDGGNWIKVTSGLPNRWVSRVAADRWDANTFYVCFSGFRYFDQAAHIYKTTNGGQTWTDISGNLPDIPVNDFIQDPKSSFVYYIATDVGVFYTENGGLSWSPLGEGLPNVPVTDLTLHPPSRTLAAATYGRAMYAATLPEPTKTVGILAEGSTKMHIYPQPVGDNSRVLLETNTTAKWRMEWYDVGGKRLQSVDLGILQAGEHSFPLGEIPAAGGVYLIRFDNGKERISRKVIRP